MSVSALRRSTVLATALAILCGSCSARIIAAPQATSEATEHDPVDQPADRAAAAGRSLLLGVARAGKRLVAVGERGHILLSDDRGQTWTQAAVVPSRTMLTAVCFVDPEHGWAVGHDEIILRTRDAGQTWALSHYAPESQQPLLAIVCLDSQRILAVGAYGSVFATHDGGVTWVAQKFVYDPLIKHAPTLAATETQTPPDYHLNSIATVGKYIFIGAESGQLFRSGDDGANWLQLPSPYKGSFFGLLALDGDGLLAFGLRGNLFRTRDAGVSWQKIDSGSSAMLTDAARLSDGAIVIVGLSGTVVVSRDGGATFNSSQQADRKGLAAVLPLANEQILAVGEAGSRIIDLR